MTYARQLMGAIALALLVAPAFADTTTHYDRQGYRVDVIDKDSGIAPDTVKRMIDGFYTVYPQLTRTFNPKATHRLTFVFDPAYNGVAATSDARIVYSPAWLLKHPDDIDVVTHETMHVVQAYGHQKNIPGWLTEGIADYVRNRFGVNNPAAGWKLGELKPGQNYTDSYRVTARFLTWLEAHGHPGLVKSLDAAMRERRYTDSTWNDLAGASVDSLWASYTKDPAI